MASLRIDRTSIINVINERDDNNKYKRSLKERKELALDKRNLADQINLLINGKQHLTCFVQTAQ